MSVRAMFALLLFICAGVVAQEKIKVKVRPQTFSRGWGNGIAWVQTYEEALEKMQKSKKPLMVIHHLEDCPHSQVPVMKLNRTTSTALKKAFVAKKSVQKLAREDFIMLNLVHETIDENLAPDGYYVPRIIFIDPSLTVRADLAGKYSNRLYAYEPTDIEYLANNMRKAKVLLHTEL